MHVNLLGNAGSELRPVEEDSSDPERLADRRRLDLRAADDAGQALSRLPSSRNFGLQRPPTGRGAVRLHSPRTERMAEKSPVTPIAMSVQTKRTAPLELAMRLPAPTPFPLMWMRGTTRTRSEKSRLMTYPDRRSARTRTSVAYSQRTTKGTAARLETTPFSNPRTMSSAR